MMGSPEYTHLRAMYDAAVKRVEKLERLLNQAKIHLMHTEALIAPMSNQEVIDRIIEELK